MAKIKVKHISVGTDIKDDAEWTGENLHTLEMEDGAVLVSNPPQGGHKVYNIWAVKVGSKYHLEMEVEENQT